MQPCNERLPARHALRACPCPCLLNAFAVFSPRIYPQLASRPAAVRGGATERATESGTEPSRRLEHQQTFPIALNRELLVCQTYQQPQFTLGTLVPLLLSTKVRPSSCTPPDNPFMRFTVADQGLVPSQAALCPAASRPPAPHVRTPPPCVPRVQVVFADEQLQPIHTVLQRCSGEHTTVSHPR